MAYTKILVVHNRLDKSVDYALNEEKTALELAIDYALNRDKTERTCYETAINCDVGSAYVDMMATKQRWGKTGRKRKGYHIIQSFSPGEVTPEQAHAVGVEFAARLLGDKYEVVVATHLNKAHLHSHIVFNSVSFLDGSMYKDTMKDYYQGIRGTSDAVCREHGLSIIEPDEDNPNRRRSRPEWEGKTTVRDTVRRDIDTALARAYTFQSLMSELRKMGYQINAGNRKRISVKPRGAGGNIRLDSLGEGYTEEALKRRLEDVRSGTSPPPPTPLLGVFAGKTYRVKHGAMKTAHHRRSSFQRLCFKYLCLLGGVKRGAIRPSFELRWELIRLDRFQRQFSYLRHYRIDTAEQLSMQYDAVQAEIDALVSERATLYKAKRDGDDSVQPQIGEINERLKPLRRELRMCVQIEQDMSRMAENLSHYVDERQTKSKVQNRSRTKQQAR